MVDVKTYKCFPTLIHEFNLDIPIHDKIQMTKYIQTFKDVDLLSQTNDDYEGGEFVVAGKEIKPNKGSAIIFPSNFMYPHQAKKVISGIRWSVVAWLM